MVQSTLAPGVIMSVFYVLTQVTASSLRDSRGWATFCGQEARFGGWLTSQVSGRIGVHTPLSHTCVLILQQQADCSGLQLLSKSHCSVHLRILSVMSKLLPTSQQSRSVRSWTGVVCQFNKIWTFFFFLKLWVLHKMKGPLSTCLILSALEASSAGPDKQVARSSGPWFWSLACLGSPRSY